MEGSITKAELKKSSYENLMRLARWMYLPVDETFSKRHLVKFIWWKLQREGHRARYG
jgi:hypothetical protein